MMHDNTDAPRNNGNSAKVVHSCFVRSNSSDPSIIYAHLYCTDVLDMAHGNIYKKSLYKLGYEYLSDLLITLTMLPILYHSVTVDVNLLVERPE